MEGALAGSSQPRGSLEDGSSLLQGMQSCYFPGLPHSCWLSAQFPPPRGRALVWSLSGDSQLFTSSASLLALMHPAQPNGESVRKKLLSSFPSFLVLSLLTASIHPLSHVKFFQ